MIRLLDIVLALLGLTAGAPLLLLITICGLADTGSPLYFQRRVGRNKKPFTLVKFRTMAIGTESVATHLAPTASITKLGKVLRRTKVDELPQLWNVLKGDMSLVGPRPNLYNQVELIEARELRNVYSVRPGITGLAQVNKVDMSTPKKLADIDAQMIEHLTITSYFRIILMTARGGGFGDCAHADS